VETGSFVSGVSGVGCFSAWATIGARATGRPFRRREIMERLCKKAGVKHFGYHAIRHLSATILAHAGLDIPSVQTVLRHKNPNTTAKYIKSLGVQPNRLDVIFEKRESSKVLHFDEHKKAIVT